MVIMKRFKEKICLTFALIFIFFAFNTNNISASNNNLIDNSIIEYNNILFTGNDGLSLNTEELSLLNSDKELSFFSRYKLDENSNNESTLFSFSDSKSNHLDLSMNKYENSIELRAFDKNNDELAQESIHRNNLNVNNHNWHSLVLIISQESFSIYIDANLMFRTDLNNILENIDIHNISDFKLGEAGISSTKTNLVGAIDLFKVYNKSLDISEINYLCNKTIPNKKEEESSELESLELYKNFDNPNIIESNDGHLLAMAEQNNQLVLKDIKNNEIVSEKSFNIPDEYNDYLITGSTLLNIDTGNESKELIVLVSLINKNDNSISKVIQAKSKDFGKSWSKPAEIKLASELQDMNMLISSSAGIQVESKRIIVPVILKSNNSDEKLFASIYSDDLANQWKISDKISLNKFDKRINDNNNPLIHNVEILEVEKDKLIFLTLNDEGKLIYSFSNDNGESWGNSLIYEKQDSKLEGPFSAVIQTKPLRKYLVFLNPNIDTNYASLKLFIIEDDEITQLADKSINKDFSTATDMVKLNDKDEFVVLYNELSNIDESTIKLSKFNWDWLIADNKNANKKNEKPEINTINVKKENQDLFLEINANQDLFCVGNTTFLVKMNEETRLFNYYEGSGTSKLKFKLDGSEKGLDTASQAEILGINYERGYLENYLAQPLFNKDEIKGIKTLEEKDFLILQEDDDSAEELAIAQEQKKSKEELDSEKTILSLRISLISSIAIIFLLVFYILQNKDEKRN